MPQFHHMTHYALDSTHLCHPKNLWSKFGLDWVERCILESFNIFLSGGFFSQCDSRSFPKLCKVTHHFVLSSVSELVFQSADSRRDMGWLTVRRRPRCAFPHQSPSAVHLSLCLLFTRAPPPSPSICLVQLPARFLFLCVCIRPTMHPVCIPC